MNIDFEVVQLGQLISVQGGFAFKSQDFSDIGVPVLKIKNVKLRDVDTSEVDFVPSSVAREAARYYVQYGDLLISMTGSGPQAPNSVVGRVARYTGESNRFLINQRVGRIVINHPDKLDPRYLYYILTKLDYQWKLVAMATGSANQANISGGQIGSLHIPLPSIEEQRAIARILGALDDKIELNRQMNTTLEALARALFQSWFVDFDPVHAKAVGRAPHGMDAATAALFPDSFEESALAEMPQGWRISTLSELFPNSSECVLTGPFGSNLHASDYRDEGTPLILVKHVNGGRILEEDLPLVGGHKLPELARYRLKVGDIVFTRVGAVGRSAYVFPRQEGWLISGQMLRVRFPVKGILNPRYLAQVYVEPTFIDMVESYALGTTRPSLNTSILLSFRFHVPPWLLQLRFAEMVGSLDMQIQQNLEQSRNLVSLRDTLLPKLLSGEIRVGEAERIAEEAV